MKESEAERLRVNAGELFSRGRLIDALRLLDQIIDAGQAIAADWRDVGVMLCQLREFAQAVGAFERAIAMDPADLESTYELGRALYELGEMDAAVGLIEKVALATDNVLHWQALASIAPGAPRFDNARVREIRERYAAKVRESEGISSEEPELPLRAAAEKVRVGYLSAHWHNANYMKPVWPTINAHDLSRVEVHLFDDAEAVDPDWSWLINSPLQTHPIHSLTNTELARRISEVDVDVLVDLSSYSEPARLGVFTRRPTPVQVAWFNSFATNGFREFDFIIGDRAAIKDREQRDYVERFVSLPLSYLTFQTNHDVPDIAHSPVASKDVFTFGCLGTQYKITPAVLDAWASILKAAQNSRIVIANRVMKSPNNQTYLVDQIERRGVDARRIVFLPPADHLDFLRYYDRIDLTLDTFPYNGGTTTMESIWQGVPVVTFDGDRWGSRTSASLLMHSPLSDFVAKDVDGYIRLAIQYSTDRDKHRDLQHRRQSMRESLAASSVCDSARLARELELAYQWMLKVRTS